MLTKANVVESAVYLKEKLPFVPEIALVLGSGIGPLADEVENPVYVPYGEIPHFKVSTAPDHAGRMVCGHTGRTPRYLHAGPSARLRGLRAGRGGVSGLCDEGIGREGACRDECLRRHQHRLSCGRFLC